MTVDPVDDCTFWYTQEYYATDSSFNWRTRIGNFKFESLRRRRTSRIRLTITKAQYSIWEPAQGELRPTPTRPTVVTVKVTSSGEVLGTMQSRGERTNQLKKIGIRIR